MHVMSLSERRRQSLNPLLQDCSQTYERFGGLSSDLLFRVESRADLIDQSLHLLWMCDQILDLRQPVLPSESHSPPTITAMELAIISPSDMPVSGDDFLWERM